MASLVRKIPDQLSGLGVQSQGQYSLSNYAFDYAVAGIPFLSATQDNRPYTERMVEIRKNQFDSFAEPGEQSLANWWLRSQSTFNGGAGIIYQDPDNDNQFNFRFADSLGIDPWTSGELQLLRDTVVGQEIEVGEVPSLVRGYVDPDGVDSYWWAHGFRLEKVSEGFIGLVIEVDDEQIFDLSSTGYTFFMANGEGIYSGEDDNTADLIYTNASDNGTIEFLKGRLIYGNDNKVYQLLASPSSPPAALPTATYTHEDPNWRWRSITDGPTAIYMAGDSGTTSEIHKFSPTLSDTGVPELAWVGVTATMPTGETIRTIYQYVGTFVGIATNKGFRVGTIDANGDITYGPLLFQPDGGCTGIVGEDRFMWVGSTNAHEGSSGLFRVDLGNTIQEQTTQAVRYAYARDIYLNGEPGAISSVTLYGKSDRKVFSIEGFGTAEEAATDKIPEGFLDTGRIRFNTEEPKLFKFFSIRTPAPLLGDVQVSILPEGGGIIPYITYSPQLGSGTKDVAITQPFGPQNWMKMRFTLVRGANPSFGGVLNGWQMKILPGSIRQRDITQIFQLFDEETDKTGQRIGYDGYARQRFEDFKAVARAGDVIIYQELAEQLSTSVIIDDWEFRQMGPPGPNKGALGGYLTVVMRTVAEST